MFRIRFWSILLVFALCPLFAATPAHAMAFTAIPGADVIANNGSCSLREALINANNNNQSGSTDCPAGQANVTDTIILLAGETYTLVLDAPDNNIDSATAGDLDVLNNPTALDLQIVSNGAERATIAFEQLPAQRNRVLEVRSSATVLLVRVQISNGQGALGGGGIWNSGSLTLENSEVANNEMLFAANNGGGIYTGPNSNLTLRAGTVVRDNTSFGAGGGIYNDGGTVTIEASAVADNYASGDGGGISSSSSGNALAQVTVRNSEISGNRAVQEGDGAGIWNGSGSTTTLDQDARIEGNDAVGHGGAIANMIGGTVNISTSSLNNNRSGTAGNTVNVGNGGAVWNNGTMFVTSSSLRDNAAGKGANSSGGAFYNTGLLVLSNSAVYANQTQPESGGNGGAIYNTKTLVVLNSTLSGNTASGRGGAIQMSGGYADIRHATITGNAATIAHGGLYLVGPSSEVDIKHSILAGNTGAGVAADCNNAFATVTSKGYNLAGDACGSVFGAATNDLVGVDPKLAALADNDGATKTHALQIGSPALNAIPQAACTDNDWPQLATDQRGIARPQDVKCEIGAYEQKPLGIVNPNPQPSITKLTPDTIPQGGGDMVLVVTGEKFVPGTVVYWKGVARTTTFVSATELKANISAADIKFAGVAVVTVFNPGPGGGYSNGLNVIVTSPDKQLQTIAFAPLADRTLLDAPFALEAIASSGLPVQPIASGACAISDGLVVLLNAGICTITVGQAGNTDFNPAVSVVRSFTITGARLHLPLTTS